MPVQLGGARDKYALLPAALGNGNDIAHLYTLALYHPMYEQQNSETYFDMQN